MKNLFVVISDVHISLKNLDVSIQVLIQALDKARELKVPLFIAGDLNDTKAIMRSEWVKALIDLFNNYKDVEVIILVGNHDLDNKNGNTNSLYFLNDKTKLIMDSEILHFNDVKFGIIPYQPSSKNFLDIANSFRKDKIKNILCHQGFMGAFLGDYVTDDSSIDPKELADFDFVGSGHYHKTQIVKDNIRYWGSPFTVSFGEAGHEKFIWVVSELEDIGKIECQPIPTNVRRHEQIVWTKESETNTIRFPSKDSLLKVVVKGTKEYVMSMTLDKFKQIFPQCQSITIVPEIIKQSENRISADIIHNPIQVIETYLNMCETSHNKDELKSFLYFLCEDTFKQFSSITSKQFKVTKVEGENFLSFKKFVYEYNPMGLTLVEGYDEDNNIATGAGKSSFLDMPTYGMFGETSKSLKSDEVINRTIGKDLVVKTYLQASDGEYVICRYRKHKEKENDLYIILPNGQELRGKDNRETQKLIEQTIGCSFDIFLKSTYFTQFGAIDRFLSASDTEKKKLISDITDLSIYDSILDKVKANLKSLETDNHECNKEIEKLNHSLALLVNQKNKTIETSAQWNLTKNSDIQLIKNKITEFENNRSIRIEKSKNDYDLFEKTRSDSILSLQTKSDQFEDQVKKDDLNRLESIVELENKLTLLNKEIDTLKSNPIIDIASSKKEIESKLDAIAQLEQHKASSQAIVRLKCQDIDNIIFSINKEKAKLESGSNSECFNCHQEISSDHIQKYIDKLNLDLERLESEKQNEMVKINQIDSVICKKDEFKASLSQLQKTEKDQYIIQVSIETNTKKAIDISDLIKNNKSLLDSRPHNPYTDLMKKEASKDNPYFGMEQKIKDEVNPYLSQLELKEKEVNPYDSIIERLNLDISDLNQKLVEENSISFTLKKKLEFAEWWKTALHVYIKSYLMDSCLESINKIANEYLETLFDGILKFNISAITEKGFEVKEKINVSIVNNGDECSYNSLSGGERCRICLAVNLALSQVISNSSGKSFNFVFFDEILNGLDEAGKTQSMRLLKDLEKQYESVYVIDHTTEFKSLFTNSIMIKKKDKVSTII